MQVTMAYVLSANGKTTRGADSNAHEWSSEEDWQHFRSLIGEHDVVVMDRKTYEMVQPKPESDRLRIVLTHHPELFTADTVAGSLEFSDEPVAGLISRLEGAGKRRLLMAGGRTLSTQFLREGLVDDLYLTYEPVIFSQGKSMMREDEWLDISLQLQKVTRLNERGTLLAHYKIIKAAA